MGELGPAIWIFEGPEGPGVVMGWNEGVDRPACGLPMSRAADFWDAVETTSLFFFPPPEEWIGRLGTSFEGACVSEEMLVFSVSPVLLPMLDHQTRASSSDMNVARRSVHQCLKL